MKKNDILNRIKSAQYLGISIRTIYNLIARGELQQRPDGRFHKKELDRYLKTRKRNNSGLKAFYEFQLKQTRLQREDLLLKILTGEIVPSNYVIDVWVERMLELKTSLMSWPNSLPPLLEGKNEQEIRAIIHQETKRILSRYARNGKWTPQPV